MQNMGIEVLFKGINSLRLWQGLWVTIRIALISMVFSIILGFLLGMVMNIPNKIIKFICRIYLEIVRIMPQLVLLFLVYFGAAKHLGMNLSGETAAVIVFTFWGTAEMGDLVRSALISIPKHQYDSGCGLGLNKWQVYLYIILPQTIRRLLPSAVNLLTRMIKTTSLVALIGKALLEPYLKEGKDILHIAFSSALSGTYNSSRIAAEELMEDYPDRKIIVVDSLGASLGQGLLVYLAQEKKEQGEDMETVAKWAEENRLHMVHLFTVNDLNHLYRGGRISRTTAVVGSMLNIKPVLHVDNDGKLTAIGKVRGRKKSLQELVKLMDEKIGSYHDTCHTIFISHGDCEEDANYVAEKVKEKYQINTIIMNQVGATIGAHSGPGTMALFFVGDER